MNRLMEEKSLYLPLHPSTVVLLLDPVCLEAVVDQEHWHLEPQLSQLLWEWGMMWEYKHCLELYKECLEQ